MKMLAFTRNNPLDAGWKLNFVFVNGACNIQNAHTICM